MKEKNIQPELNFNTEIESSGSFYYTKDLFSNDIEIIKYIGKEKNVVIPKKINGLKVISIGEKAFKDKEIQSIILNENIVYIKKNAFQKNKIIEIKIPENIKVIEQEAFKNNPIKNVFILNSKLKYNKEEVFPKRTKVFKK